MKLTRDRIGSHVAGSSSDDGLLTVIPTRTTKPNEKRSCRDDLKTRERRTVFVSRDGSKRKSRPKGWEVRSRFARMRRGTVFRAR